MHADISSDYPCIHLAQTVPYVVGFWDWISKIAIMVFIYIILEVIGIDEIVPGLLLIVLILEPVISTDPACQVILP